MEKFDFRFPLTIEHRIYRKLCIIKKKRVDRGLFVSNKGIGINADVNGAYQIMKKIFPKVFADGIEGVALHPVRVSIV